MKLSAHKAMSAVSGYDSLNRYFHDTMADQLRAKVTKDAMAEVSEEMTELVSMVCDEVFEGHGFDASECCTSVAALDVLGVVL